MKDRIERVSRILFRKIFERERIFLPFIDEIRRDSMLAGVSIASRKRVIHRLRPRHRIMEMYLAPILILYYFPAEFSRHLYDNARQRRKFSHFPAREILPPPRIILPPSVSIALQRGPRSRTGHKLSSLLLSSPLSPLQYTYTPPRSRLSPPPSPPADQFSSPHQTVVAPRHAIHPRLGFRISGYFYRCPYPLVHPPDSPRSGESETRGQKSRDVNLRSALFCRERTVYYDGKRTSAFIYPAIRRTETIRFGFRYPAFDSRPFRFRDLRFRNEIVARSRHPQNRN